MAALLDPAPDRKIPLDAYWDSGLWFASTDKDYRLHVGGALQWDSVWLIGPKGVLAEPSQNAQSTQNSAATELRRARLRVDGSIWDRFDYMIEYDFANAVNENNGIQAPNGSNISNAPTPLNVWVQMRDVPWLGTVRIGNQTKPIGMTNNTSAANLTFMERSYNSDAFYAPFDDGFATGISAANWTDSERATWKYGIFRPERNSFGIALDRFSVIGRVTALPLYENDGEQLIHVGFGSLFGDYYQDQYRVRARALLRNGPAYADPVLADTDEIDGSRQFIIAPEFAAVCGPWTFTAEWAGQFVTGTSDGTVFFHGGYVETLCFLTGEHSEYDKHDGVFGRVIPKSNFGSGGCGAWQIGARFSYLDATDQSIDGGRLYDGTLGINWYLNPNMKMQLNCILGYRIAQQNNGTGWYSGVGVRAACDF